MIKDLKAFILRGNVVNLAIAVVVGSTFGAVVTAFVKDMITPLITAIIGKPNFANLTFTLNGSHFAYGDFLNALITFLSIVLVVFFFIIQPINKLQTFTSRNKNKDNSDEKTCTECLSIIPKKAKRCMYCTSTQKVE